MMHLRNRAALVIWGALCLVACDRPLQDTALIEQSIAKKAEPDKAGLGLMTSLPIYWPLGVEFTDLVQGGGEVPWQRQALEQQYDLVLLDTLSSISGLSADDPEIDPLEGLERLAIIQPRGLSPSDNVALDQWVRAGGKLLLVLDPMLTADYDLPLGDPRRPVDTALIPPMVKRWGLDIGFELHEVWEDGVFVASYPGGYLPVSHGGTIAITDPEAARCTRFADHLIAQCSVGAGRITLLADAHVFDVAPREPSPIERQAPPPIPLLLRFAFD